jgi:hypothetical protein
MTEEKNALAAFLAERDALFRNPRAREARLFWDKQGHPPPVHPSVPLAAVHKARLQWLDATDAMLAESQQWLEARGYETTMKGTPPLNPARRDADREILGKPPLPQRRRLDE